MIYNELLASLGDFPISRLLRRGSAQLDRADDDYGAGTLDAADYKRLRTKWTDERNATLAETERLLAREKELDEATTASSRCRRSSSRRT